MQPADEHPQPECWEFVVEMEPAALASLLTRDARTEIRSGLPDGIDLTLVDCTLDEQTGNVRMVWLHGDPTSEHRVIEYASVVGVRLEELQ